MSTPLHILIATHDRPTLLGRTLASIAEAQRPPALAQVWVVENGSDAGARDVCATFNDRLPMRYVNHPQPGKSRALNAVINGHIADGLIVFLDDDIRMEARTLRAYADAAAVGRGHILGGPFGVDYETPPPDWLIKHLPWSARGWTLHPNDKRLHFVGCNYALFAADVRAHGGFRTDIGPGASSPGTEGSPVGQETEFMHRLEAAGFKRHFVRDAMVWHYVPANRCTVEWALQRIYRHGLSFAFNMTDDEVRRTPTVAGLPRWMLVGFVRRWLAAMLAPISDDEESRFLLRRALSEHRGRMVGFRKRRRQLSAAAAPQTSLKGAT